MAAVAALALSLAAPGPARAQNHSDPVGVWQAPAWTGDVAFVGANALLSGLTAGVLQALRDGSFQEGFARGALGGAVAYGGRRVAAQHFWGAGLLGRQVSAVGASLVRNASEARPALSRIALPAGPVSVYLHRGDRAAVQARVDAHGTAWLLAALLDRRLELDESASLSAGAPVFRAPRHRLQTADGRASGLSVGGVILLGADAAEPYGRGVFAHERVHVLQYDFAQEVWGDPLEDWAGARVPGGGAVLRVVRPGVTMPGLGVSLERLLDWGDRPWEIEASFLQHR